MYVSMRVYTTALCFTKGVYPYSKDLNIQHTAMCATFETSAGTDAGPYRMKETLVRYTYAGVCTFSVSVVGDLHGSLKRDTSTENHFLPSLFNLQVKIT